MVRYEEALSEIDKLSVGELQNTQEELEQAIDCMEFWGLANEEMYYVRNRVALKLLAREDFE